MCMNIKTCDFLSKMKLFLGAEKKSELKIWNKNVCESNCLGKGNICGRHRLWTTTFIKIENNDRIEVGILGCNVLNKNKKLWYTTYHSVSVYYTLWCSSHFGAVISRSHLQCWCQFHLVVTIPLYATLILFLHLLLPSALTWLLTSQYAVVQHTRMLHAPSSSQWDWTKLRNSRTPHHYYPSKVFLEKSH